MSEIQLQISQHRRNFISEAAEAQLQEFHDTILFTTKARYSIHSLINISNKRNHPDIPSIYIYVTQKIQ